MFAVLKTGGKQYKVSSGDILKVEKLAAMAGETIQFNEVLMVGDRVGEPFVEDAAVQAQVIDQIKDRKVIHFVRRRRKHGSKRTKGHRQQLTLLRITEILETGAAESGIRAATGAGSVRGTHVLEAMGSPEDPKAVEHSAAPGVEDTVPASEEGLNEATSSGGAVPESGEQEGYLETGTEVEATGGDPREDAETAVILQTDATEEEAESPEESEKQDDQANKLAAT